MPAAPIPSTEPERLLDLRRYQVLDTEPEEAFDAVTRLASQLTGAPFALVGLTDRESTMVQIPGRRHAGGNSSRLGTLRACGLRAPQYRV